ncbi:MAG TPA: hypothetical protein VF509_09870 [Sphingobium sp.]
MHILALIFLAIIAIGCIAFGIFLFMARLGHKRAWKEYIEQDRERRERREQMDAGLSAPRAAPDERSDA